MFRPEWNLDEASSAGLLFAEWLNINGGRADNFIDAHGVDPARALAAARARGWVEVYETKSARRYGDETTESLPRLAPEGLMKVQEVSNLRTDRLARVAACRQAILLWLAAEGDSAPSLAPFLQGAAPQFYNVPFTEDEAHKAAKYLSEKGLLTGWPYPPDGLLMQLALTPRGTDCVEIYGGDVRLFYSPMQPGGSSVTNNQQNNFYGGNAQASQGDNNTQTQNIGLDAEALARIFQPMHDALPAIEDADERGDVEHAIRELEAAASGGDIEQVEQRAGRLQRLVEKVGSAAGKAALGAAATVGIKALFVALGIPQVG